MNSLVLSRDIYDANQILLLEGKQMLMTTEKYMLTTYKQRRDVFKRLFKDTDAHQSSMAADFSCAIHAGTPKILQQGRLYVTLDYVCFHCRILTYEQKIIIKFREIVEITKEKTAMVFPNAIQISLTNGEKHFFTSFTARDKSYQLIEKFWSENKHGITISSSVFWDRVRDLYGNELGFSTTDPEEEESRSSQFNAHFRVVRRPSEIGASSQDESLYESFDDRRSSEIDGSTSEDQSIFPNNSLQSKAGIKGIGKDSSVSFNVSYNLSQRNKPKCQKKIETINNFERKEKVEVLPPASCVGHEHFSVVTLDEEFNMNVGIMWKYIFTDHAFFRALCAMRCVTDLTQSSWPDENDANKETCRTIYYTVNLKNKIGPKKSPTVEKQSLLEGTRKNYIYIMETNIRTVGIPLSDTFHVLLRYCLLYINENKTRMRISYKIVYDKSAFFPTKSIIESSVRSGCIEYCKDLKFALLNEAHNISETVDDQKVYHPTATIEDRYQQPIDDSNIVESPDNLSNDTNVDNVSWIKMVLVCFIALMILYFLKEIYSVSPSSTQDNILVKKQVEIDSVNLDEMIHLIKEMKKTIDLLKDNIEKLNQSHFACMTRSVLEPCK